MNNYVSDYKKIEKIIPKNLVKESDRLSFTNINVKASVKIKLNIQAEIFLGASGKPKVADWVDNSNYPDVEVITRRSPEYKREVKRIKGEFAVFDKQVKQLAKKHNLDADDIYGYLGW